MRKRIIILAIVLVVLFGGWTIGWFYAAGQLRQNVEVLAAGDGQAAPKVTCARLAIGGYPFWLDATCTNLTVVSGDLNASLPTLKASLLVYDPFHAVAFATGPLTLEDAFSGSRKQLSWTQFEASARLSNWRIARISVIAGNLALADALGATFNLATASHAEIQMLDDPVHYDAKGHLSALRVYAEADDVKVPGLNIADAKTSIDGEINRMPDDVRTYGDPELLQRWQTAGGTITLRALKGADGTRNFNVTGQLGLDTAGKPSGQLQIASKGLVEQFGTLIPDQMRPLILGNPATDGSYHQTLNLTNGLVLAGVVPLAALPSLY